MRLDKLLNFGADIYIKLNEVYRDTDDRRIKQVMNKIEKLGNKISRIMVNNIKDGNK